VEPGSATAAALVVLRSRRGRRVVGWALAGAVLAVAAQVGVVVFVIVTAVSSTAPAAACPTAASESLSIMGPPLSTPERVMAWWGARPDPPRLDLSVDELVRLYYAAGVEEGVRPEVALAQAVHETGRFTSTDTSLHNYAGIGHPDGARAGRRFRSPEVGVRAHVQLLRAYAEGNEADFASERVAPRAGARAATLLELAGTWATDPSYAVKVVGVLGAMIAASPLGAGGDGELAIEDGSCAGLISAPVSADGYALPVDRSWYERRPWWFWKPHHDYPAADIPVPEGAPVYAMVSGVVTAAPVGGRCGLGVAYRGDDGLSYVMCHGSDGGEVVRPGARVSAGQLLMHASWTGNVVPPGPAGTHLHVGIRRSGVQVCPQPLLRAVAEGDDIDLASLPVSGCVY
jgi:murein DD-endopeptidase MepM/ murein hydrolase activator NlpD